MSGVSKSSITTAGPRLPSWPGWLVQGLAIDVRSLAAFRVALATVVLIDLAERAADLTAHYTDAGVLPRAARIVMEHNETAAAGPWAWSLHMAAGTTGGQAALFLAAAVFGFALLIGYRTRLAAAASWLLTVSVCHRNPILLDAGDTILQAVLFWSMFLPLGAAASVDRRLRGGDPFAPREIRSLPGAALLLQICTIYWATAAEKSSPVWLTEHTALYYALSLDAFATPLGHRLLAYPRLLTWLTMAVYGLEWLGPAVAIFPLLKGLPRLFVVLAFWAFHLGTAATMELGALPWISMAIWTVFLPGILWDKLGWRLPGERPPRAPATPLTPRLLRHPDAPYRPPGKLVGAVVAAVGLYVAVWNINEVSARFEGRLRPGWKVPAYVLGLDQNWGMFAPPLTDDGWYEMRGVLADGSVVNLWDADQPLPRRKPANVAATYRNRRWLKYLMEIRLGWAPFLPEFADWLRRRWNERHADEAPHRRVKHIDIVYHIEKTLSPERSSTLIVPEILFEADYNLLALRNGHN
ncbi:MAG TPA: HTTM domain-containing protein [Pirellulales bacterium]|nr:HTTM domain-containing protein [Pirellulales bacterium]